MRKLVLILIIVESFYSCSSQIQSDFEFGIKYNDIRQKFGSPLIKKNMVAHHCCEAFTVYEIDKLPNNYNAYHSSKTISTITNGKLTEEKDIYRKNLDDSTVIQLNILTLWNWDENKIDFRGNTGKIDKRTLKMKAKDFITKHTKYPQYGFADLDKSQIDSVLKSWQLSRFDKE